MACSGHYVNPPEFQVITGDHIQDISGQDEETFYLNTYDMHRLNRYVYITGDHIQDISGQDEETFYLNTYDMHRLNRYVLRHIWCVLDQYMFYMVCTRPIHVLYGVY